MSDSTRAIVVGSGYSGFALSEFAMAEYNRRAGTKIRYDCDIPRDCPHLVVLLRELGSEAVQGSYSFLSIVEIPSDVEWQIEQYDGSEWVAEKHRTWFPK